MKLQTTREPSTLMYLVVLGVLGVLGWCATFMPTHCAAAGPGDPPFTTGSTGDGDRAGRTGERKPPSGLDNTPSGGTLPGGTVPGDTVPGGTLPGGMVPGGTPPGGTLPGGTVPGGTVPSEKLPGEDG